MKMKKVLKVVVASVMACAVFVTTASALGSVTKNGAISDTIMIGGKAVEKGSVKAVFDTEFTTEDVAEVVVEAINALNENPAALQEILKNANVELPSDDGITLEHVSMLTSVQNLELRDKDGNVIKDAKDVTMTWEVPNLSEEVGVVRVLHYSTVRNVWELLVPESVDYANKTITVNFPDLSPVAVVYVPKDKLKDIEKVSNYKDGSIPNKGPNTGDESNMMVWIGLIVLSGLAIAGVSFKKMKSHKA